MRDRTSIAASAASPARPPARPACATVSSSCRFAPGSRRTRDRHSERLVRQLLLSVLESPGRFRAAHHAARLARLAAPLLSARLRGMLGPATCRIARGQSASGTCARHRPAPRPRRAADRLRAACAPAVDQSTQHCAVLAANGVEVVVPPEQGCCGALALHSGLEIARRCARRPQRRGSSRRTSTPS